MALNCCRGDTDYTLEKALEGRKGSALEEIAGKGVTPPSLQGFKKGLGKHLPGMRRGGRFCCGDPMLLCAIHFPIFSNSRGFLLPAERVCGCLCAGTAWTKNSLLKSIRSCGFTTDGLVMLPFPPSYSSKRSQQLLLIFWGMQNQEKVFPRPGKVEHPEIWICPLQLANIHMDNLIFKKDSLLLAICTLQLWCLHAVLGDKTQASTVW